MATQSSVLSWRIPWTELPGGLQSMGFTKSRTQLSDFHFIYLPCSLYYGNTQYFLINDNSGFSLVQLLNRVRLFMTPRTGARQASLSITISRSLLKLMSIESVMPSSRLILCRPLLLLPPTPPSIRVFSNESSLGMRWPKYWRTPGLVYVYFYNILTYFFNVCLALCKPARLKYTLITVLTGSIVSIINNELIRPVLPDSLRPHGLQPTRGLFSRSVSLFLR